MSTCRHGGRDVYERPPIKEYDQSKPIRGRIVYEDGSESKMTFARYVNGMERKVSHVEVDGKAYVRPKPEPKVKTCPECGRDEWWVPGLFEPRRCVCGASYE